MKASLGLYVTLLLLAHAGAGQAQSQGFRNNPEIGANAAFLGQIGNRIADAADDSHGSSEESNTEHAHSKTNASLTLQEIEIALGANVDPFFRADILLGGHGDGLGVEAAYLTTLALEMASIRVGKMQANLGRHNLLHTHAYQFVDAPLPWREILGDEGLRDTGLSVDILLPLPVFAEINLQAFAGDLAPFAEVLPGLDEMEQEDARGDGDFAYIGHLKTLFELGTDATIEFGGSVATGGNFLGGLTTVAGGDLTVRWRPSATARYTELQWTTEYLWVNQRGPAASSPLDGAYTSVRYRFARQWWCQARGAVLGLTSKIDSQTTTADALLAFIPSEYSALRLQYGWQTPKEHGEPPIHQLLLQAVVSIGAHPAHTY